MRGRMVGLLAAALLTAGLGACSDDSGDAADTTTTSSSSTSTTTTSGTSTPEPVGDVLPDGEHHGYITRSQEMDDGSYRLGFDLVYLLTGDEAVAAAAAHGVELDTDYYLQNDNPRERELPGFDADEVSVTVIGGRDLCCDPIPVDYRVLEEKVYEALDGRLYSNLEPGAVPLVKITIADGRVTRIDEVFLA